jgi:transposase-like protein
MYSAKDRDRLVAEYEASTLSAHAFCRRVGINRATLRAWLRERAGESPSRESLFARVKVEPARTPPRPIEVHVGEATIVVAEGFDPKHLRAVVEALRGDS